MKKIILPIICLLIIAIYGANSAVKSEEYCTKSIEGKLIRFHVIANSDSIEDQALKLAVRDKILEYIYPKLNYSEGIEQSRKILRDSDDSIKKIAQSIIKERGYNYNVSTTLSKENFPIKSYGNITLPQGEYEAYRIIIGSGSGKNWWCVMFPPLCFIDITKGEVAEKQSEVQMRKVLSESEYSLINNKKNNDKKIEVRFKVIDLFKNITKRK